MSYCIALLLEYPMKKPFTKYLLAITAIVAASCLAHADKNNPYIFILGVTQDAGFPQSDCYEPHQSVTGQGKCGEKVGTVQRF